MKAYTTHLTIAALLAVALLLAVVAPSARAEGRPVEVTLALAGGATNTVSATFQEAASRDVASSLQLQAVEYTVSGTSLAEAATLSIRRAASGPAYKTATVATNVLSGVSFETNSWYVLPGDLVHVTLSATNAASVRLTFTER